MQRWNKIVGILHKPTYSSTISGGHTWYRVFMHALYILCTVCCIVVGYTHTYTHTYVLQDNKQDILTCRLWAKTVCDISWWAPLGHSINSDFNMGGKKPGSHCTAMGTYIDLIFAHEVSQDYYMLRPVTPPRTTPLLWPTHRLAQNILWMTRTFKFN